MNQAQLAETLNAIATQNEKAHAEIKAATAANLQAVQDLTEKLLAADAPISAEAFAALTLVQEASQKIDDLNPDVVVDPDAAAE